MGVAKIMEQQQYSAEEDDLEFAVATAGTPDQLAETEIPRQAKKELVRLARQSAVLPTQIFQFLAGVELDNARKAQEYLGLEHLYRSYCANGGPTWLNPLRQIRVLEEILTKYSCNAKERQRVLVPLIDILCGLAAQELNPYAFLKYIMIPRLRNDYEWRKWPARHHAALRRIGDILLEMKQTAPFDKTVLGSPTTPLARDIVLVKYAGRPLARQIDAVLTDTTLVSAYKQSWQQMRLDNTFTIFFLKTNVLHFMYALSGKIGMQNLIRIIENMPVIERGFTENYPDDYFGNLDLSGLDLHLYDYDMDKSIQQRKNRGYSIHDLVVELRGYMEIIAALMNVSVGIYLCAYYARQLTRKKNPELAPLLAELIAAIDDRGGKHIYIWHTKQLLAKEPQEQKNYIDYIRLNQGHDPEYPRAEEIFRPVHDEQTPDYLQATAESLGLTMDEVTQAAYRRAHNDQNAIPNTTDLVTAYIQKNPASEELINRYKKELLAGDDRAWTKEMYHDLDRLGSQLARPLQRLVIRGLKEQQYCGYRPGTDFMTLYHTYHAVSAQTLPPHSCRLTLPVTDMDNIERFKEQEVRQKINLTLIKTIWHTITQKTTFTVNDILPEINAIARQQQTALEKQRTQQIELKKPQQTRDAHAHHHPAKALHKTEKAIEQLQTRYADLERVMREFPGYTDSQKMIAGLCIAAHHSRPGEKLSNTVMALLVERYRKTDALARRLEYLEDDIAIELLTCNQFEHIINVLELLDALLAQDVELQHIVTGETDKERKFAATLSPFFMSRDRHRAPEILSMAYNKLCSYSKLEGERARWQSLLEAINGRSAKYYHSYNFYLSKSPLDSLYGHMGSICLSGKPEAITRNGFYNIRLVSEQDRQIVGMALVCASRGLQNNYGQRVNFWHAFAFNPLDSVLKKMSEKNQLLIYLGFRKILEEISTRTHVPVVLSGVCNQHIISNRGYFSNLIMNFEKQNAPNWRYVSDADGLSLLYQESDFAKALIIIDPADPATYRAANLITPYQPLALPNET